MARGFYKKLLITTFLLCAIGIAACLPSNWSSQPTLKQLNEDERHFYVVIHGYHTSLVLPMDSAARYWHYPGLPKGSYLSFAWGDSAFYRSPGQPLGRGLSAVFCPTPSVMHVVSFEQHPKDYFADDKVYALAATPSDYQAMLTFIGQSFEVSRSGHWEYLGKGKYKNSGFYKSAETYHGFYNCNNWVTTALKKAGHQAPLWGGFPFMVTLYL